MKVASICELLTVFAAVGVQKHTNASGSKTIARTLRTSIDANQKFYVLRNEVIFYSCKNGQNKINVENPIPQMCVSFLICRLQVTIFPLFLRARKEIGRHLGSIYCKMNNSKQTAFTAIDCNSIIFNWTNNWFGSRPFSRNHAQIPATTFQLKSCSANLQKDELLEVATAEVNTKIIYANKAIAWFIAIL